ncbi:RAP2.4-like protein [Quillaja saponaria]|uniref:RAP2.4-like protein n=1 Tax=Quillaja saponaria TaxID=32244 RepID=A0AAD7LEU5_QUISA|nr:RAP2.4-like protein [Quillaja saponaria]
MIRLLTSSGEILLSSISLISSTKELMSMANYVIISLFIPQWMRSFKLFVKAWVLQINRGNQRKPCTVAEAKPVMQAPPQLKAVFVDVELKTKFGCLESEDYKVDISSFSPAYDESSASSSSPESDITFFDGRHTELWVGEVSFCGN